MPANSGPRVAIFEPYVFPQAYGNLRYVEAIFRHLRADELPQYLLIAPRPVSFAAADSPLTSRAVCVPAPDALLQFGGAALSRRQAWRVPFAILRYTVPLWRALRQERVTVVQCHNVRGLLTSWPAARLARADIVWYVKGHLDNPLLDRFAYHAAARVLFQNATNMTRRYPHLVARHASKIRIVENGIDLSEVAEATSDDRRQAIHAGLRLAGDDGLRVAYSGQLSPLKGVHDLVEAMAGVETTTRASLWLLGDHGTEEYRRYADDLARTAGHRLRRARFLGYRADALTVLSFMDVFALPSLSEGVPRSILEAMALGLPVVASAVGGVAEVVDHGVTGFLFEPGDTEALARHLRSLAEDPALRNEMGRRGRERVESRWPIERNIARLREVHGELGRLAPRHRGRRHA